MTAKELNSKLAEIEQQNMGILFAEASGSRVYESFGKDGKPTGTLHCCVTLMPRHPADPAIGLSATLPADLNEQAVEAALDYLNNKALPFLRALPQIPDDIRRRELECKQALRECRWNDTVNPLLTPWLQQLPGNPWTEAA